MAGEKEQLDKAAELVDRAKHSEAAERYDDMRAAMMLFTQTTACQLTKEQRNLLSVAYKNVVGSKRSSWRVITSIKSKATDIMLEVAVNYQTIIEKELQDICNEVLSLLDEHLIPICEKCSAEVNEESLELMVFLLKMKGDYYRYLAEVFSSDESHVNNGKQAYDQAVQISQTEVDGNKVLWSTNPIVLGLWLNYSVFYYEILKDPTHACEMAKKAYQDAVANPDEQTADKYKDGNLILQLLRDNITLWTSDACQQAE